jgi:predicted nucleic acid-binding protein
MIDLLLILIDTSIWVPYLRRNPNPALVRTVQGWLTADQASTTPIVQIELLQAARDEVEFDRLSATLDALHLLMTDDGTWRAAAHNAFTLRRAGVIVPTTDILIATLAQQHGAQLAHADRHYELMAPFLGLQTISFL